MIGDIDNGSCAVFRKASVVGYTLLSFYVLFSPVSAHAAGLTYSTSIVPEPSLSQEIDRTVRYGSFLSIASSKSEIVVDHKKAKNSGEEARQFVDVMAKTALNFLADQSLEKDKKKQAFADLLNDSFDMKTIGRFSLGRYWRVSTSDQRSEYLDLFQSMVVNVYSERFLEYSGQGFETRGFRKESDKDTVVTSFVIPENGPEIQVDWRIRYKDGRYKVVDVIVEGVSMSMTQRSDFAAVIQRGGGNVSVLLDHLRGQ